MRLRAPTTCPKWNEWTDEDIAVLHWLSKNAGLTSECITEVIEPFTKQRLENTITGTTWNEAAKRAAIKQVMQPLPCPPKAVESTTVRGHPISHFRCSRFHPTPRSELRPAPLFELELRSAPISELRSTLKSELRSAFTSGVTTDVK